MKQEFVWAHFHYTEFKIPIEAIGDICQQGANDEAVAYWQPKIAFHLTRGQMIEGLGEYGAWSRKELSELTDNELEEKVLWIAAWDAHEESESVG